jgi:hypothetical protein
MTSKGASKGLDWNAMFIAGAVGGAVCMVDSAADQDAFGKGGRAGVKTFLGALAIYLNVCGSKSFGKPDSPNCNETHLKAYMGTLVGVAVGSLYLVRTQRSSGK